MSVSHKRYDCIEATSGLPLKLQSMAVTTKGVPMMVIERGNPGALRDYQFQGW